MFLLMFAKGRKNVSESSLVGYKNNNINSNDDVRRRSCWRFIFGSIANQWRWRMSDNVQKDGIMYWGQSSAVNWDCNSKSHNGIKVWNMLLCILQCVNLNWMRNSFAIFPIISLLCLLVHFIRFNCSTNKLSPPSSWEMIFFGIYASINWCDK